MAIDTAKKRKSAYFQMLPWLYRVHDVDGTIDATDREIAAGIYGGITPASVALVTAKAIALTFFVNQSQAQTVFVNQNDARNFHVEQSRSQTLKRC